MGLRGNLAYLKDLTRYWQHDFDWSTQESQLNRFAQFHAQIDGTGIHFIHGRGIGANPLPLMLLHGWPDSFYRFHKVIPMLTDPARYGGDPVDAFDLVVPSLTGFGFSDRPLQRGGGRNVELLPRLMTELLGYQRFGVQDGYSVQRSHERTGQLIGDSQGKVVVIDQRSCAFSSKSEGHMAHQASWVICHTRYGTNSPYAVRPYPGTIVYIVIRDDSRNTCSEHRRVCAAGSLTRYGCW